MKIVSVNHALYFRYSILESQLSKERNKFTDVQLFSLMQDVWYILFEGYYNTEHKRHAQNNLEKILSTINVYVPTEYHLKGWLGNLIWWLIMKWENRKLNLWKEAQWDNAQKVFSVVPGTQWSLHKSYPFFLLLKLSEVSLLFNLGKRIRGCLIPCSVRQKIILL